MRVAPHVPLMVLPASVPVDVTSSLACAYPVIVSPVSVPHIGIAPIPQTLPSEEAHQAAEVLAALRLQCGRCGAHRRR